MSDHPFMLAFAGFECACFIGESLTDDLAFVIAAILAFPIFAGAALWA